MSSAQKITDEFADYIIKSNKTKMTMDDLFKEFVNTGYFQKCKENLPTHLTPILEHWDDNTWKMYIWNYVKLQADLAKLKKTVKKDES